MQKATFGIESLNNLSEKRPLKLELNPAAVGRGTFIFSRLLKAPSKVALNVSGGGHLPSLWETCACVLSPSL